MKQETDGSSRWRDSYHQALSEGDSWLEKVRPGDRVFVSSAAAEPAALTELLRRSVEAGSLPPISVTQMFGPLQHGWLQAAGNSMRVEALSVTPAIEKLIAARAAEYLPMTVYEFAESIRDRQTSFDVCLLQLSPPDESGSMSFGVAVDFAVAASSGARLVVAEVNRRMPRTLGGAFLSASRLTAALEVSTEIPELPRPRPDEDALRIGALVAGLIPARATIEMGIGDVMTAVMGGLGSHSGLGLHTGLLVDPMVDLIESGVITGEYKEVDRGLVVANQARGTRRLYDFLDNNPVFSMREALYTHAPSVLGRFANFYAVNSAIAVDLAGRVNSEFIRGARVSGAGGLPDFVRIARAGKASRSIIALRSSTRDQSVSRIVERLPEGEVTLGAELADMVVTEHGIADLRNASLEERANRMIAIAEPHFREELRRAHAAEG